MAWAHESSPNLGVRVLAEGAAALVRRADPDAEVVTQVFGHGPSPINIGSPRSLARAILWDDRGFKSWIKQFDLVIDTGAGDSFSDIYGLKRLRAFTAFGEAVRHCGIPLILGPQTIGPFRTVQGRVIGRWSLRRADLVMVRDHVSGGVAARMGRPAEVPTTDLVFALPVPETGALGSLDVVVNVSGLLWAHDDHLPKENYRAVVRELLAGLAGRGREVTLLAHVLDSRFPDNDVPTVHSLAKEFGMRVVVPADVAEVRRLLRAARLVFGSRMHACLNSLSVGTPAIPLAYSRKFEPLLADLGWPHVVDLNAPHPAGQALDIADDADGLAEAAKAVRARADLLLVDAEDALKGFV